MAKLSSEGKIPKKIGDYIVYQLGDETVMRRKSGFDSEKMQDGANYQRSRDNATEFGKVSALCKKMRLALKGVLPRQNNLDVCNALLKNMHRLLAFDTSSARGGRNLGEAFTVKEARDLFEGYSFNPKGNLEEDFSKALVFDDSATLSFPAFEISAVFSFPEGADSLKMRLHHLEFDFKTGESQLFSGQEIFFLEESAVAPFVLSCAFPTTSGRTVFSILEIQFFVFQEGHFIPFYSDLNTIVTVLKVAKAD